MIFERFHYKDSTELLAQIRAERLNIPFSENIDCLGEALFLDGKRIPNRLLAQPIEGFDAQEDGSPGKRTLERYRALAKGGSGTIWLESVSVCGIGRSNQRQLWIRRDNVQVFQKLREVIREASPECYTVLQLTHSGRNSTISPDGPQCAIHNPLIPVEKERIISDDELDGLQLQYIEAAELAAEAGFDAVDIRACHGYLINELLAARERAGKYGGSFENRSRFLLEVIQKLQQKKLPLQLAVRLNLYDGLPYPYGFGVNEKSEEDRSEGRLLIEKLALSGVKLLNITNGIGRYSPYLIRPYDVGSVKPAEHPLCGIQRMLEGAALAKKLASDAVIVASGFSWLRQYAPYVCAGGIKEGMFDLAGFGRQTIFDPDYANKILNAELRKQDCCITCSGCTKCIKEEGKELRCIFHKGSK